MEKAQNVHIAETTAPGPSLLRGFYTTRSEATGWPVVYDYLRGNALAESTRRYRETLDSQIKRQSVSITPAVLLNGRGKHEADIVAYTGVGMADFDHLPPERMEPCIDLVRNDPHTFIHYVTLSGNGLRVLYRYNGSGADYAAAFRIANEYYARLIGAPYDEKCANPGRLSALCHDPNASFHPNATPFEVAPVADAPPAAPPPSAPAASPFAGIPDDDPIAYAVALAEQKGAVYTPGSRNDYLMRCLMNMNRLGVDRTSAEQWALGHPGLPPAEVRAVVRSCYSHTAEHATWQMPRRYRPTVPPPTTADLPYAAGTPPYAPPAEPPRTRGKRHQSTPMEIARFLNSVARYRLNVITDHTELCWNLPDGSPGTEWRPLTDRDVATLWMRLSQAGLHGSEQLVNSIIQSDFTPKFHPFEDYFDSLPPWDGTTDHIALLARRVRLTDPSAQLHTRFTECLRKWLVALIAGIFRPDVVNHEILVFIGRQGNYKSTFFAYLLPPQLQAYFYTKLNIEQVNKDDLFTLTQHALVCFEEIDCLRPSELNRLKALTTMRDINERRAYGRHKERRPHIASFCATGNNVQFLNDRTGNRRWLPFEVDNIDSPMEHPFDYEGIYSQAWALYRDGFQYWFSGDDINQIETHNATFEAPCLEEELIMTYYALPAEGDAASLVSTATVLERINASMKQTLNPIRVGLAMKKLGFAKVHTYQGARYRVRERTPEEMKRLKQENGGGGPEPPAPAPPQAPRLPF